MVECGTEEAIVGLVARTSDHVGFTFALTCNHVALIVMRASQ
jgi:hypothetical protein